jgi:hypothetical protein
MVLRWHRNLPQLQITGTIPTEIGLLTALTHFAVHGETWGESFLTGTIPTEIGKLTAIGQLCVRSTPQMPFRSPV